ncbi:MAG: hypothetical protein R2709_06430 [Marmoricola sp.]
MSAVGQEVKSPWTFINPWRYYAINQAMATSITISEGTGPFAMLGFGRAMTQVNGSGGLTCAVPIRDLAVHWDTERARAFELLKTDWADDITPDCARKGPA